MLQLRKHEVELSSITDVEMIRSRWLIEYPSVLNIRLESQWLLFHIIDKKIFAEAGRHLNRFSRPGNLSSSS